MRLDLSSSEGSRVLLINHTKLDFCPFERGGEPRYSLAHRNRERLRFIFSFRVKIKDVHCKPGREAQ